MNVYTPNLRLRRALDPDESLEATNESLQLFIDWLNQRVPELSTEQRADLIETLDVAMKPFIRSALPP